VTKPKFIYLLNADDVDPASIPRDAFVVYQGHHGDLGAQLADVCLPGSAYTEKSTTWVNTEGRSQLGRAAVPPPGAAREDWKIIRYVITTPSTTCNITKDVPSALSEILDSTLPYDDVLALRDRMWELSPSLVRYDTLEHTSTDIALAGLKTLAAHTASAKVGGAPLLNPIANFYQTDPISRACVSLPFQLLPNLIVRFAGRAGR
jgi:NADH dehydrogenase (ubiquinone) Fe-S protein 1